jgi:branched-subunit amino acid ABC-type transport system permease component
LLILLSTVFTGLLLGAIFSMVAAGVTVIYGSIWLPNAANGQIFLLSCLACWVLSTMLGVPSWLAVIFVVLAGIPAAYLLELALIRRFYDVADRNIAYFVVTLGLAQILWGIQSVTIGRWSDIFTVPPIVEGLTFVGPFPIANNRLLALGIAIVLWTGLFITLRRHRYGRALRAVFQNREGAALRGVNVRAVYLVSFVLGNLIILMGGALYAMAYSFDLTVAWTMSVIAFAIMIVGGPGSVLGAMVMGMIFGFTQAAVSAVANPMLANFAYLGLMLLILLIRPSGLFAR